MSRITDAQVQAALRIWWGLTDTEPMPWESGTSAARSGFGENFTFRANSLNDMRGALETALDSAWAAVNSLGGRSNEHSSYDHGFVDAIDRALEEIEKLGGRDPLVKLRKDE